MVQNIGVFCFNRELAKKVCTFLAEKLDMYYMDEVALIEFDNIPYTLTDILKLKGRREFRDKEKGTIKYMTEFNNTVIYFETGAICKKDNVKQIKRNCELVYIKADEETVKNDLQNVKYSTSVLKNFYCSSQKTIHNRMGLLQKNADIVVSYKHKSAEKVANEVLDKMQKKYTKNA